MKNHDEIGTALLLPVWLTAAAVLAAASLLYFALAPTSPVYFVVLGVGIVAAASQLIGRRAALARLGDLAEVSRISLELAKGRLAVRNADARQGSLQASLLDAQRSIGKVVVGVAADAEEISAGVGRVAAQTNEMALTLQLQANINQEVETAIGEIDRNIRLVSGLAAETEADSRQVADMSRDGETLVTAASGKMERIVDSVSRSSAQIASLVDSTREIGSIANIIKEIADQTNLLALNAAIEAARAGEQGRGFAVVADEVRKLAERTAGATAEISKMIAGIQSDTKAAVEQMKLVAPELHSGVAQARDAAQMLSRIREQAHGTLAKISDLAEATAKESAQAKDIVGGVAHMIAAAEKTESIIRDTAATSAKLEARATALEERLAFFGPLAAGAGSPKANIAVAPLMTWSTALAVGHAEIDDQHRKLIEVANRLNEAMRRGEGRTAIGAVLDELVRYTTFHFEFEESLMKKSNYPDVFRHQGEHKKLVGDVLAQKAKFDSGEALSSELLSFLRDWLVNHILKTDKALASSLRERAVA